MTQETIILDFELDVEDSVQSIDKLTAANKELRKERNALNLATESGKKRAAEINAVLDQNTATIKKNSSAIEQMRANVGNYKSALDGVHPTLGKVGEGLEAGASGFKAMAMQALRFVATPIGAVLAALVAVFTLLKTALSQNSELMDRFENVTNAVGTVVQVIIGRIGKLGEALIAFASGEFSKGIDLTASAFTGLATEINAAAKASQLYLDLSRDLEDAQRELRLETIQVEQEVKRLEQASKNVNLTLDEQEEILRKILDMQRILVAKREEHARKDLIIVANQIALAKQLRQTESETFDQFILRLRTSSRLNDEEVDTLIDKIEALKKAQGESADFQQKIENALAIVLEKKNKLLAEEAALREANRRAQNISDTSVDDPLIAAFETRANVITDLDKRLNDDILKRDKETKKLQAEREQRLTDLKAQQLQERLAALQDSTRAAAVVFGEESAVYRTLASAQTLISTYSAAQKSYDALAGIPVVGPALGGLAAAFATAEGLARVAAINGIEFAEGGYTGHGGKYDPAGIVHRGEVVWSQKDVALAGGPAIANAMRPTYQMRGYYDGGLVTNSAATPANDRLWMTEMMKNLGPFEVSAVEMTKAQKRVKVKERISKR